MVSIFDKYSKRGAYHWQQVSRNIFRHNAYVAARYAQVVKLVPRVSKRVLDIGCGDGVLLSLIGDHHLYGVDLDQASLDYAATRIKARLIKAAAESLPFKSNYFDLVIATEIIEHLAKPEIMLREIKRVLKPRGRVILTTPVKSAAGLTDKLHHQEFSPDDLKQLCAGYFRRIKITTSHPQWLKRIYTFCPGKLGRYYLDIGRWLINLLVLLTDWNPFLNLPGKPSQQLALGQK